MKPKGQSIGLAGLSVVKTWIDRCSKSHKKCNESTERWYPTRLLHLKHQDQGVRLIISKDNLPNGRYMTLSHRWGRPQSYTKLETSTMAQLQTVVDITTLPQIFQDTIKIASFLGIYYLWIDALCIKQDPDDRSDWNIESQTMGKVYANSFLNVSATMSVDGTETLFRDQDWDLIAPSEIQLSISGRRQTYYALDGDLWGDEISNTPLNDRGWVFQERFLARRVLHFGKRQMGWECRELGALEMLPNGIPRAYNMSFLEKARINKRLAKARRQTRQSSDEDWLHDWHSLVTQYSRCRLSDPNDKLIAFAGVGDIVSASANTEFVAGMLKKTLVYDLLWWRDREDRELFMLNNTSSRAPSWSWASVDGEVHFPNDLGHGKQIFVTNLDILTDTGSVAGSDPLGRRSHLSVEGVYLPLKLRWSGEDIVSFAVARLTRCKFSVNDSPRGSSIDLEGPDQDMRDLALRGKVLLLPLFLTNYFLNGILITRIRGIGVHRRIGTARIPVMVESGFYMKESMESTNEDDVQLDYWLKDPRAVDDKFGRVFWNYTAYRLWNYVNESGRRVIEIV